MPAKSKTPPPTPKHAHGVTKIVVDNIGTLFPRPPSEITQTIKHKINLKDGSSKAKTSKKVPAERNIQAGHESPTKTPRKKVTPTATAPKKAAAQKKVIPANKPSKAITGGPGHHPHHPDHQCDYDPDIDEFCKEHGICTCGLNSPRGKPGTKELVTKYHFQSKKNIGSKEYSNGERSKSKRNDGREVDRCKGALCDSSPPRIVEVNSRATSGYATPTLDTLRMSQYKLAGHPPWARPTPTERYKTQSDQKTPTPDSVSSSSVGGVISNIIHPPGSNKAGGMPFTEFASVPTSATSLLSKRQATRESLNSLSFTSTQADSNHNHDHEGGGGDGCCTFTGLILFLIFLWLLILTIDPFGYLCQRCIDRNLNLEYDGVYP